MDSTWPDEETIRDEIQARPRDIVIEEVRVRPSGKKLTWPQYQAAVENAYLQESQTVEGFSACEVELSCHEWFDRWDELEVMSRVRRLYEAEEAGAEQHRRRLYEIRAELDESFSAMSYDEFAPWRTGSVMGSWRIRAYVWELEALIEHYDDCKEFFSSLVREAEEDRASWKEMAERLAVRWENDPSAVPWFSPRGLDVRKTSFELLKITWPLLGWREGFVDQSELHILVRSGGTDLRPDEPEGIDIALVGPDENEQLIVEFLPMIGVDPEAGQDARHDGVGLIERTVDRGSGNPWQYAKHHCGTGANMYSLVRFVPMEGRKPTET